MGILDELRDKSTKKQADDSAHINQEQLAAKNYKQDILPRMQLAFKYFKEITEHVNFLDQAIEVVNYSNKYQRLGKLKQVDYKINTDEYGGFVNHDEIMHINISFLCVGDGEISFKKEGKGLIESEVAFLHKKNIPFSWKYIDMVKGSSVARFNINKRIPVKFRFEVDYPKSKINLLINNHLNFDSYKQVFEPGEVNQELLDEIASYMLRKDYDFIRLRLSNKERKNVPQELDESQREHINSLKKIYAEEPVEEKKGRKFFSRQKK